MPDPFSGRYLDVKREVDMEIRAERNEPPTVAAAIDSEEGEIRLLLDLLSHRIIWNQDSTHTLIQRIHYVLNQQEEVALKASIEDLPVVLTPLGNILLDFIQRLDNTNRHLAETTSRVRI